MLTRTERFILLIASVLLLTSCSGGSGAGSGSGSGVSLSQNTVSFNVVSGATAPAQSITISAPGAFYVDVGYPSGHQQPTWIRYQLSSMTSLVVQPGNTAIAAGSYTDTVYIQATKIDGTIVGTAVLTVKLTVTDPLTFNRDWLEFNTAVGATSVTGQGLKLSKVATYGQWTASADQPWASLSAVSGALPATLNVTPNLSGLTQGSYTSTITVTDVATGEKKAISVTLNIEPHKLFVAQNGVALTAMPSRSHLTQTVSITDNGHTPTAWTATSDQPSWLTVGPVSGTTDGALTLTADTSALVADTIYYATVTVSSSDPSVAGDTIRVGFYVRSTDPVPSAVTGPTLPDTQLGLVSDPIRPYVYVSYGDARVGVYNVHDHSLLTSIAMPAGSVIRGLAVSSDGASLYAVDHGHSAIIPIDLTLQSAGTPWTNVQVKPCVKVYSQESCPFDIVYARPNGHAILLTGDNQILDPLSGGALANFVGTVNFYGTAPIMVAAPNGESFYAQGYAASGSELLRYQLRYSDENPTPVSARIAQYAATGITWTLDMAVSPDSSAVYTTVDDMVWTTGIRKYSVPDLAVITTLAVPVPATAEATNNVAIGPTGIIYGCDYRGNVVVYNSNNTKIASYTIPGPLRRQMTISGDGLQLISRSSSASGSTMSFLGVTP